MVICTQNCNNCLGIVLGFLDHKPFEFVIKTANPNFRGKKCANAHLSRILHVISRDILFPEGHLCFLEDFFQRLYPLSWGGPQGPNSQGKAKPYGQVYAL